MNKPFKILFIKACHGVQVIEVPMGLMYLSAYLKSRMKETVRTDLVDLRLEKDWGRTISKKLTGFQPDLIGISLLSGERPFLEHWSAHIKRHAPGAAIVIGGPLATYDYEEVLKEYREIDFAVLGEGETSFLNLVQSLLNHEQADTLPGVAFWNGEKIVSNGRKKPITDLDAIPFPDYSLIDPERYTDTGHVMNGLQAENKHTQIISSRGCPYGCLYCHNIFGKKFRARSPENFVSEIKWLYERYGIREFHIVDDIFNFDRKRMHDILHRIINSGMHLKLAFPNGIRSDLLDKKDILLLKQAGCFMLTFAIETASERLQKRIRKNLDIDKAIENIRLACQAGIITRGFFMLGFPGETAEEIKATISLARRSCLDLIFFFTVVIFKNTGLDRLAAEQYPGLDCRDSHFWGTVPFYQQATGYPLKRVQTMAYIKFYLPFRVFRTFLKLPRKRRILSGWVDMAFYVIFTPWYEYLERKHQQPALPPAMDNSAH